MSYYLFLDDVREPIEVYMYIKQDKIYLRKDWTIVRDYDEFVTFINDNGIPDFISLDHDLSEEHYAPIGIWDNHEKAKKWQEAQVFTKKTGFDCVAWLVNYCIDNKIPCPDFYCHTQNTVGKENMESLLNNFKKHQ